MVFSNQFLSSSRKPTLKADKDDPKRTRISAKDVVLLCVLMSHISLWLFLIFSNGAVTDSGELDGFLIRDSASACDIYLETIRNNRKESPSENGTTLEFL